MQQFTQIFCWLTLFSGFRQPLCHYIPIVYDTRLHKTLLALCCGVGCLYLLNITCCGVFMQITCLEPFLLASMYWSNSLTSCRIGHCKTHLLQITHVTALHINHNEERSKKTPDKMEFHGSTYLHIPLRLAGKDYIPVF